MTLIDIHLADFTDRDMLSKVFICALKSTVGSSNVESVTRWLEFMRVADSLAPGEEQGAQNHGTTWQQ